MTEDQRLSQAKEDVAQLAQLAAQKALPELDAMAHRFDKLVRFVIGRDAGANLEAKSEIAALKEWRKAAEETLMAKDQLIADQKALIRERGDKISELDQALKEAKKPNG